MKYTVSPHDRMMNGRKLVEVTVTRRTAEECFFAKPSDGWLVWALWSFGQEPEPICCGPTAPQALNLASEAVRSWQLKPDELQAVRIVDDPEWERIDDDLDDDDWDPIRVLEAYANDLQNYGRE